MRSLLAGALSRSGMPFSSQIFMNSLSPAPYVARVDMLYPLTAVNVTLALSSSEREGGRMTLGVEGFHLRSRSAAGQSGRAVRNSPSSS